MQDFIAFLSALRDGQAIEDYRKALIDMEERVAETGKAGVLTLQITMKPASKGNRSAFAFTDKVAFDGGENVVLDAKLRFSKPDSAGKVKFKFDLSENARAVLDGAINKITEQLSGETGVPVFKGRWTS